MPCEGGSESAECLEDRRNVPRLLCGIFSVLDVLGIRNALLDQVDWKEAGIDRGWAERWWTEHKLQDDARRLAEEKRRADERARKRILAKLTVKERRLLGLLR